MTPPLYNDSPDSTKSKAEDGDHDEIDYSSQLENAVDPSKDFDQARENALLRKMDLHIVPWLSLLYLLSFLDRANIGNARVSFVD